MDWNRPVIELPEDIKTALAPKKDEGKKLKKPTNHIPPNSPWAICAVPTTETRNSRYLYQLMVDKNRRWTITLIDTSTGNRRNHASGSGGILSMNKQVYSGEDFAKLRGVSL